jgi:TPR repeat protein
MKRVILAIILWLLPMSVWADFQDGVRAYKQEDYRTAFREWRPLAEQGEARAQFNLGIMYAQGKGIGKNYLLSYVWLSLANKNGHNKAKQYIKSLVKNMSKTQITEAKRIVQERIR